MQCVITIYVFYARNAYFPKFIFEVIDPGFTGQHGYGVKHVMMRSDQSYHGVKNKRSDVLKT